MPVPSAITDLSTVAGSNSPAGTETPGQGDDYLRALSSFLAQLRDQLNGTSNSGTIKNPVFSGASTGTLTLAGATLPSPTISGTPVISSAAVTWSGNPTHSGNHTFSGNTVLGDALGDTLNVANGAFKVFSDGRVSGNKLHNIGALTGTTDQFIASGTYTPTGFTGTNVSACTPTANCKYIRVGNIVHVGVVVALTITSASTGSACGISLPIASALAAAIDVVGVAVSQNGASAAATNPWEVDADISNGRIRLTGLSGTTTGTVVYNVMFTYEVR